MTAPPGRLTATTSTTGRPPQRVTRDMRRRLTSALATATGMTMTAARAVIAQRAGDSVGELEAWLRSTYRLDPTGVTAVRNVMRGAR